MKVLGIGLSKTGTQSLAQALMILGFNTKHYPKNMDDFERYDALVDIPVSCRYKELDRKYPGSKFIFTNRPFADWIESGRNKPSDKVRPNEWAIENRIRMYGTEHPFDEVKWTDTYYRHQKDILDYFSGRNDLLVLDLNIIDKWSLLCHFLDRPIPGIEYPWKNKTKLKLF